ncbi:MAG TPA: hypothetical protein VLW26_03295 [Steroidobacteraceae bacterium]|nr:hypothetical protein [Steroidobacteraceae bacterium]
MSAVLLAVFDDFGAADQVRTQFVRDGFPTDRIDLTASCELGRAALEPAPSMHGKFVQYYRTLFSDDGEEHYAEVLADRIEQGGATITLHPRGPVEIERAREIFEVCRAVEVAHHDLENQRLEHAAARGSSPWLRALWIENDTDAHCIYCLLFERNTPTTQ